VLALVAGALAVALIGVDGRGREVALPARGPTRHLTLEGTSVQRYAIT
jgi:hypothetical protein